MCVFRVRARRELDRLVASAELNIEPSDDSMDEVISSCAQVEWPTEGQVFDRDSIEVEADQRVRVSHDCLHLHGVDKWLCERSLLERAVVKAPNVVPDYDCQ